LANDIIQNGKRKGTVPEYIKGFENVLNQAMAACSRNKDPKVRQKIQRVITIWETRQVFSQKFILALRQSLTKAKPVSVDQVVKPRLAIENEAEREVQSKIDHIRQNRPESPIFDVEDPDESSDPPQKKQKLNRSSSSMLDFLNSSSLNDPSDDEEPQEDPMTASLNAKIDTSELEYFPTGVDKEKIENLEQDDLIAQIKKVVSDSPSADEKTRERLNQLPAEVQDSSILPAMEQKGKLDALFNMILFGSEELKNYNERLEKEVDERQHLNLYLKTIKEKKEEELKDSSATLKKTKKSLSRLKELKHELEARIQSLPDLSSISNLSKPMPIADLLIYQSPCR